ncbi:unnamed protein product [Polarella glacialis]|uniref:Uncharacterized protein n=1 Tax=Polarella glacialis TaxID=89957 RepID=A0A813JHP5_POLGL|nr:unnamed protein product [Polarella glacialis]
MSKELSVLWQRLTEKDAECSKLARALSAARADLEAERARRSRDLAAANSQLRTQAARARRAEGDCALLRAELSKALGLSPRQSSPRRPASEASRLPSGSLRRFQGESEAGRFLSPKEDASPLVFFEGRGEALMDEDEDEDEESLELKGGPGCGAQKTEPLPETEPETERGDSQELSREEEERPPSVPESTTPRSSEAADERLLAADGASEASEVAWLGSRATSHRRSCPARNSSQEAQLRLRLRVRTERRRALLAGALLKRTRQHARAGARRIRDERKELAAWRDSLESWWQETAADLAPSRQQSVEAEGAEAEALREALSQQCYENEEAAKPAAEVEPRSQPCPLEEAQEKPFSSTEGEEAVVLTNCSKDSRRTAKGETKSRWPKLPMRLGRSKSRT